MIACVTERMLDWKLQEARIKSRRVENFETLELRKSPTKRE